MQSESTKCDGTKSDLRIRCPKSSDFGPKEDPVHRILESKNSIGQSRSLTEQTLVQEQYDVTQKYV